MSSFGSLGPMPSGSKGRDTLRTAKRSYLIPRTNLSLFPPNHVGSYLFLALPQPLLYIPKGQGGLLVRVWTQQDVDMIKQSSRETLATVVLHVHPIYVFLSSEKYL